MKFTKILYSSCEMSKKQKKYLLITLKRFLDRLYRSARVSKSEIQRITGTGTHTCSDSRNYQISTLYTFFRAIEQIHQVKFEYLTLLRIIEKSINSGTELIISEVKPGEEIPEGSEKLMKRQPRKKGRQ
ncbi:hypothetical protein [Phocaeicola sp. HCN-6420]|jgi:hypothetical protein|uniref:hypothetical protein n=1 Tax=Phocaeicola sp. HCN-6420 TaxID=3134673 RepID=UPI0030BC8C63